MNTIVIQKATRDIITWKYFELYKNFDLINFDNTETEIELCLKHPTFPKNTWEIGKEYESPFLIETGDFRQGLVSFKKGTKHMLRFYHKVSNIWQTLETICLCKIPQGAYYTYDGRRKRFVSDRLIVISQTIF